jgi:broad specificity phosphatase PhoE
VEDWSSFRDRVRSGFQALVEDLREDEQAGIFTSGGVISVLMQPLMDEDDSIMARLNHRIANASITLLELDDDRPKLQRFNDYAHLEEPDLVTFR